eukprot:TRINITY_DN3902_c0_g1_i2.p1 TRINITY_DN3902_c0_g1~~TRINITY_DN3902_c0_g1_i2.p1  ORF type:complete len:164 (+),score=32.07 TRINITY_DN3902_c0_g1_i2:45-536(+)
MGIWTYVASIAVPVIGGMISGLSTREGVKTWYQTIRKPTWNPPKQVFPIVWTSLYAMMGVASGIVWSKGGLESHQTALVVYGSQLAVNLLWSPIFFVFHQIGGALVHMTALWGLIVANVILFWDVSDTAGALMIPYLLWVSFAWYLNFTIWNLNKKVPKESQS